MFEYDNKYIPELPSFCIIFGFYLNRIKTIHKKKKKEEERTHVMIVMYLIQKCDSIGQNMRVIQIKED